ncbi:MbcA/ParS/Xre antitoxin family protein [Aliivibrio sp. S4TY2]|uniref:DUF2384 domain-containing protein n=1 Tax=Aliivibrio finisterrensis TaxID=511998 RepID=A0A4Q5KPE8_9GAMM|nr:MULTISPECIES: MbcA/ParS/Xre antitoxin family protein [Aliivibrio]MDD9156308.1 MbcA/ParS/Xre antitoxin family protein [Aliivibrio sp. S4TY2]MDD9160655.1 MbcA/ParS/Xre antitoxin family protein [Aliivibrio sp. S4TY1]MDD9164015.1 MbcA/ParS/Xre antitoxin family protein [Aliivibrio sp. S4MY2]MDD9168010.1 MbcA/ParS/Xre antitoxin family protein [Aliivibrio sp. S4MY4]MDD9177153.1 MbcA/ParS/Xre antitoxin family protein [Aliivibrio sp. A6]
MNSNIDRDVRECLYKLFNDEALCNEWLSTPKQPLNGLTPLEVLKLKDGKNRVLEMIERIELGDFS